MSGRLVENLRHSVQRRIRQATGFNVHRWPSDRHLTLDYPVSASPRYGFKAPPLPAIVALLEAQRPVFEGELREIGERQQLLDSIPTSATEDPLQPYWDNGWFPALDSSALMHFLLKLRPARYLEIGSGNSTLFAKHAIRSGGLSTTITSIDPQPRRGIDTLCDHIVRQPLENVDLAVFDELESGDILFFDGSHRVFNDSDVTVFFLEILPRIKKGVVVHIHDIFLPHDYPEEWGQRYYSEQYMFAMLLLYAPEKLEIMLANAFISLDPALSPVADALARAPRVYGVHGLSFWFRVAQ